MTGKETGYWDAVAAAWDATRPQTLWRMHSDAVNVALIEQWLPEKRVNRILKTDVFDEAFGGGLLPLLMSRTECLISMDVSLSTLGLARKQYVNLCAAGVDVRSLPFTHKSVIWRTQRLYCPYSKRVSLALLSS